jgi:hypothetical protein
MVSEGGTGYVQEAGINILKAVDILLLLCLILISMLVSYKIICPRCKYGNAIGSTKYFTLLDLLLQLQGTTTFSVSWPIIMLLFLALFATGGAFLFLDKFSRDL